MRQWVMLLTVLLLLAAPSVGFLAWIALSIVLSDVERRRPRPRPLQPAPEGRVAILYMTCNDFNPSALMTLICQKGLQSDVFVLDDSTREPERRRIDDWVQRQPGGPRVVRRSDRTAYKSGNVNHWIARFGNPAVYPYVLIVDADEHVPPDFAIRLLEWLRSGPFVFAQACHMAVTGPLTLFQRLMHLQVESQWVYQAPARNLFGVPPMLGHGVLLCSRNLAAVGGLPDFISEDLALTILLAERGLTGILATNVIGYEEFPRSYHAYWRRRCRFIRADLEIVQRLLIRLWRSPVPLIARLDLSIRELRLPTTTTFWVLLSLVATASVLGMSTGFKLSPSAWGCLPLFLLPTLPALRIKRLRGAKRLWYILTMAFVGAATSSLYPVAFTQGLRGYNHFEPTGDLSDGSVRSWRVFLLSDVLSAALFVAGGVIGDNLALMAVGLAAGCSPLLRTQREAGLLRLGVLTFWSLLAFQFIVDIQSGAVPIEHLLVLVGLVL